MLKPPKDWATKGGIEGRFYRQPPPEPFELPICYRPNTVVRRGSARDEKEFDQANLMETMADNIVLTICPGMMDRKKAAKMHRKKIDLADEVLVINPGGYIGPSTRSEIAYARKYGKHIRYWRVEKT